MVFLTLGISLKIAEWHSIYRTSSGATSGAIDGWWCAADLKSCAFVAPLVNGDLNLTHFGVESATWN
jgi:hypothetical protein